MQKLKKITRSFTCILLMISILGAIWSELNSTSIKNSRTKLLQTEKPVKAQMVLLAEESDSSQEDIQDLVSIALIFSLLNVIIENKPLNIQSPEFLRSKLHFNTRLYIQWRSLRL